jgi:hypothetical protein
MNLDAVLASATTDKSKKDKSKALEVAVAEAKVIKKIDTWLESSKQVDLHKAKMISSQDDILDFARKHHLEHVESNKVIPATVKLVIPTGSLSIDLAKNQYSKIQRAANEENLKTIFGVNFSKCFTPKLDIKLTEAALSESGILETLIKAVGADNFKKYFEVEQVLKPTPALHEGRFLDPTIKAAFEKAVDDKLVAPFAPSFKG